MMKKRSQEKNNATMMLKPPSFAIIYLCSFLIGILYANGRNTCFFKKLILEFVADAETAAFINYEQRGFNSTRSSHCSENGSF